MKRNIKRICVFCASSMKVNKVYFEATERLADIFVDNNIEVVFGGGSVGLMGRLADTVIKKGGRIVGIMPHFMRKVEWAHKGVAEFHFTETMHERKELLLKDIDALVALPGGSGTMEELLEAVTLKRLGQFTKPIVILNTNKFYDPLHQMLEKCIREGFMSEKHRNMWNFVDHPENVLEAINKASSWNKDAIHFASVR
jgi:uncharacterized protein (TIGR00730 family)